MKSHRIISNTIFFPYCSHMFPIFFPWNLWHFPALSDLANAATLAAELDLCAARQPWVAGRRNLLAGGRLHHGFAGKSMGKSMENQWKIKGKAMENQWKINGKSVENQWKISGKSVENQWKISGKSVENQWKISGKAWESMGKSMGKSP